MERERESECDLGMQKGKHIEYLNSCYAGCVKKMTGRGVRKGPQKNKRVWSEASKRQEGERGKEKRIRRKGEHASCKK